jgi:hypothetical protein
MADDSPSSNDVALLARQADLDLPPEYLQQLVSAYGHVRRMIDRLPLERPRGDEPAHIFDPTEFVSTKE